MLLAARRSDIASIRTVAGNLDHAEVTRLAGVSPLSGSLNPIDVARQVGKIPQVHFIGTADKVVPAIIATRFVQAVSTSCARIITVPGADHESGWTTRWREVLEMTPTCD